MKPWPQAIRDGAITGSIVSAASTVALAVCGLRETGSPYAPTNAISHWLWGDEAARQDQRSVRYTMVGYTVHHASAILWAVLYEKWFGDRADDKDAAAALAGGAAVAGLACFVDYKLTPHRLQPGYEMRLSRPALFLVYATVGAGLAVRGLAASQRRAQRAPVFARLH